jgi:hypothetical protein
MLIPVVPAEGLGEPGADGSCDTCPVVVNDQVADAAIIEGATGVALVRDTTFQ